jgi:hypothetical protein
MRFSLVLVIAATLIASVYASDAKTEGCSFLCKHDSDCSGCNTPKCVSSLRPGFNHTTDRRGIRTSLYVSGVDQELSNVAGRIRIETNKQK